MVAHSPPVATPLVNELYPRRHTCTLRLCGSVSLRLERSDMPVFLVFCVCVSVPVSSRCAAVAPPAGRPHCAAGLSLCEGVSGAVWCVRRCVRPCAVSFLSSCVLVLVRCAGRVERRRVSAGESRMPPNRTHTQQPHTRNTHAETHTHSHEQLQHTRTRAATASRDRHSAPSTLAIDQCIWRGRSLRQPRAACL